MHLFLLNMGKTKFRLKETKLRTTVWKNLSKSWKKLTRIFKTDNKAIGFSEVTLQLQNNLSMTKGLAINLSKVTKRWSRTIVNTEVSS